MSNNFENTTFKEDFSGFFLDGNFNSNKYDVDITSRIAR